MWGVPFVYVDEVTFSGTDSAEGRVRFGRDAERFTYGGKASPALGLEAIAQLSYVLVKSRYPDINVCLLLSINKAVLYPETVEYEMDIDLNVRLVEDSMPVFTLDGVAIANNKLLSSMTYTVYATQDHRY